MAKKLTIEERKAILEEQMAQLDVLGDVEEEINSLIENYEHQAERVLTESYQNGLEPNQGTNYRGELLWKISEEIAKKIQPDTKWPNTTYTEKELSELGYTLEQVKAEEYHYPHYEERKITFEEASSWEKNEVRKYRKLVELLKGIEIA